VLNVFNPEIVEVLLVKSFFINHTFITLSILDKQDVDGIDCVIFGAL
jgi:hypothetical protein